MIYRSVMIEKSYQQTQYYRPPMKLTDFNVQNVLYTVYWESSAEEKNSRISRILGSRKCFLATVFN